MKSAAAGSMTASFILFWLTAAANSAAASSCSCPKPPGGSLSCPGKDNAHCVVVNGECQTWCGDKSEHVSGDITAVDAAGKTFTVKVKAGDKTLVWDDKTVVTPKGSSPAVGDKVTVTLAKGSNIATKIAVHKPKADKPKS